MGLLDKLLGDCAPYIYNLVYDIDVRMLFVEVMDDPDSGAPDLRLVFPEIISYQEKNLLKKVDDETLDDIVDIEQLDDDQVRISTYKKEILLNLKGSPFVEEIE